MITLEIIQHLHNALNLQMSILEEIRRDQLPQVAAVGTSIITAQSIITTGVGKSGFIAQKLSSSLMSLGRKSRFLHPTEALHGDIGIVEPDTLLIVFSKSGTTAELLALLKLQQVQQKMNVVAITADANSWIAQRSSQVVLLCTTKEYDDHNLLPTASTTTSLAIADLIVATVARMLDHPEQILRETHPQGSIGRLLTTHVSEVMKTAPGLPVVSRESGLREAIEVLNTYALGVVCSVDHDGTLCGIVTDGDIRRLVYSQSDLHRLALQDVVTAKPVTVGPNASLQDALMLMEKGKRKVMVLPVVQEDNVLVGVIRMHDIITQQISE